MASRHEVEGARQPGAAGTLPCHGQTVPAPARKRPRGLNRSAPPTKGATQHRGRGEAAAAGALAGRQLPRWVAGGLRFAALGCMALIAVLSLLPAEDMVRTGVGGHIEHAAAYAGTALLAGVGFSRHGLGRIAAMLVVYAGVLEPLQHFSPGRHPGLDGWLASSFGVLGGIGLAHCALALQRRADGKCSAEPDAEGCTPATPRPRRGTAAPTAAE